MTESRVDARFYDALGPVRLAELAERIGAELTAPDRADAPIIDATSLRRAGPKSVTFYQDKRYLAGFETTKGAACIVTADNVDTVVEAGLAPLVTENVQSAIATAVEALFQPRIAFDGEARIHPDAEIDATASIAATATVGEHAQIGANVVIGPGASIGPGVSLGENVRVGASASVMFCDVGANSVIQAGAVIGDTGFGARYEDGMPAMMPHIGRVQIGRDVLVGSNTTIDRGMFDDTIVEDGAKIDNLVQIAHNVLVGSGSIVAGCCGISGSVVIGKRVVLGGSVGIADHITVGDDAKLAGATLVMRDVPAGETWAGTPARPIKAFFREIAALQRLSQRRGKPGS